MTYNIATLRDKVRVALDDILPSGSVDSFGSDVNKEIEQALLHAAEEVTLNAPAALLEPTQYSSSTIPAVITVAVETDGSGVITLPATFLRMLELQMNGWPGILTELVEPNTDEARMQRSVWSRGCPEKPKAMLSWNSNKPRILFWTAAKSGGSYDSTLKHFTYVEQPTLSTTLSSNDTLNCAARQTLEKNIIFTACRIFLTGKKETALADKFAELASIY